jgi:hypothetical protein
VRVERAAGLKRNTSHPRAINLAMKTAFDVRVLGAEDVVLLRDMLAMFGRAFGDPTTYAERQPRWVFAKTCCTLTSPRINVLTDPLPHAPACGGRCRLPFMAEFKR